MEKTLLIRADGNAKIGLGHLMRCISVARQVQKKGMPCVFITADEDGEVFLKEKGFSVHCLRGGFDRLKEEIPFMKRLLRKYQGGLLVDSYFADAAYYEALKKEDIMLACFDEFGKTVFPVDLLINYNIYAENLAYQKLYQDKTILLLGSQFAPLREEFNSGDTNVPQLNSNRKRGNRAVKKILITTGGSDPYHITLKLLKKCVDGLSGYDFVVVAGRYNEDMEGLKKLAADSRNIFLYQNAENMADLMEKCDIAVSAGGSTLYELCALRLPTVTFAFADNQLPGTLEFGKRKLMINLGDIRLLKNEGIDDMYKNITLLIKESGLRESMSERMQQEADGNGAGRIAEQLVGRIYEDTIRKAGN